MNIREYILNEIKNVTGKEEITGDMNLYKDLEMCSLDAFELLANLEGELGYELDEEMLGAVTTVDELIDTLEKLKGDK